jgi:hypothetical protein
MDRYIKKNNNTPQAQSATTTGNLARTGQEENKTQGGNKTIVMTSIEALKEYLNKDSSSETSMQQLASVKQGTVVDPQFAYGESDPVYQARAEKEQELHKKRMLEPRRIDVRKLPGRRTKIYKYAMVARLKTTYGIGPHKWVINRWNKEYGIVEELPRAGGDLLFGIRFEDGSLQYLDHTEFHVVWGKPATIIPSDEERAELKKLAEEFVRKEEEDKKPAANSPHDKCDYLEEVFPTPEGDDKVQVTKVITPIKKTSIFNVVKHGDAGNKRKAARYESNTPSKK